jgi:soluble lytic murein transglycosylase-like protein
LSHAVRTALSAAVAAAAPPEPVLPDAQAQKTYADWLHHASQRLARYKKHAAERQEFLQTLWYEARRAGLPLSLVLGVVQVESGFRKYAISSAGARGYMQVMPFWARLIGDGDDGRLFHMQTNLRFGCVILRHYLDRERGDLFLGLGRYNGSRGQAVYPQAVLAAQRQWVHAAD